MWIELNDAEQRLANFLARSRFENARGSDIPDNKQGPQSNEVTDLEGMAAEIAFCKLMNVYPDTSTDSFERFDCVTTEIGTVDVKATKYSSGHLLAVRGKKDKAPDSYALMIGKFPKYRFVGWIPSTTLLQDTRLKSFGNSPCFAMPQDELLPIPTSRPSAYP